MIHRREGLAPAGGTGVCTSDIAAQVVQVDGSLSKGLIAPPRCCTRRGLRVSNNRSITVREPAGAVTSAGLLLWSLLLKVGAFCKTQVYPTHQPRWGCLFDPTGEYEHQDHPRQRSRFKPIVLLANPRSLAFHSIIVPGVSSTRARPFCLPL